MAVRYYKIDKTKNLKSFFGYKKKKSIKTEIGQSTEFYLRDEEYRLCPTKIGRFVSKVQTYTHIHTHIHNTDTKQNFLKIDKYHLKTSF